MTEIYAFIAGALFALFLAFLGYLFNYFIWSEQRVYKNSPTLPIYFRRRDLKNDKMVPTPTISWIERNKDWYDSGSDYHDVITLQTPNDPSGVYSTRGCWFYASFAKDNYSKAYKLKTKYPSIELDYNRCLWEHKFQGPWYPEKSIVNKKVFTQSYRENKQPIWWIFYFKDNIWGKDHCYCRRFVFNNDDWEIEREQNWNHFGFWYKRNQKSNDCKKCGFPKSWKKNKNSDIIHIKK